MSAPQSLANIVLVQLILFGVYLSLFIVYAALGELKKHSRVGQAALTASCVLTTVHSSFVFYESYLTAVSQDRSSFVLENGDLTWNVLPMLIGIITAITEGFLAARAGQLIASRLIRFLFWGWLGVLIALVLIGSAVTCADGVLYYEGAEAADLVIQYSTGNSIYFWASCVADISVSAACAWSLRARIAGFNPTTDSLLRHLISIAFRTAAYTAVFSLVSAILATVYGDDTLNTWIVYCFWMFMPAAYGLSLFTFATSSKRAIEQRLGSSGSHGNVAGGTATKRRTTFKTSAVPGEAPIPLETIRLPRTQPLQIHVQHEQVVSVDHNEDRASSKGGSEKHHGPEWEV
uniref:FGENESH: predicted gene_10.117 protein n=1 Tax=Rhodotorula toruloides TaxID=5286 RepID=A0A0K3CIE3_RHOTO